nr:probable E3 ubiquitin-protein ligase RNF217 [Tanacetum cinerariifolium]
MTAKDPGMNLAITLLNPYHAAPKFHTKIFNRWDGDVKRCVCPSCLKPFCYQCKVPWHDGYTCEETRDGNNVDFDVVYERNGWKWKRCPK